MPRVCKNANAKRSGNKALIHKHKSKTPDLPNAIRGFAVLITSPTILTYIHYKIVLLLQIEI